MGVEQAKSRRVLVVSYTFPPVGGAGVQRVAKFVKYLDRFGWRPTVLTVANPSVPTLDRSLLSDVPAGTEVCVARSWEPGYLTKAQAAGAAPRNEAASTRLSRRLFSWTGSAAKALLQPDPQILWYPGAVREGMRLLRARRFDAVFATAPPFSTFLVAAKLARTARLQLVVDYRDEWSISNAYWENRHLGPITGFVQERMQRSVLRAASAVVATTQQSATALRHACRATRSQAEVSSIYNGFDPDDFPPSGTADTNRSQFRLVYTGTLWNLTSVAPLVAAVRRLVQRNPSLAAQLQLVFAGRRVGQQAALVETLRQLPCRLEIHDYLAHADAIELLNGGDASCLLLSDVPGAERVVPAKLFEYMACRRPLLAILPRGESWSLLDQFSHSHRFEPNDSEAIASWLEQSIRNRVRRGAAAIADPPPDCFNRVVQAEQLAKILLRCCGQKS